MKEKIIKGLKWFYRSYIWLGIVLLGLDILTKQIVLHLPVDSKGHIAEWGFVNISFVLNEGAAFGMGTGNQMTNRIIYLVVASIAAIGVTTYLILKRKETNLYVRACLIMIVTGAVGNMIDRIFYGSIEYGTSSLFTGSVVDWIDFYWFWGFVFNIADCCIVIAAFMLVGYIIYGEVKEMIARRNAEITMEKDVKKPEETTETDEETKSE